MRKEARLLPCIEDLLLFKRSRSNLAKVIEKVSLTEVHGSISNLTIQHLLVPILITIEIPDI